MKRILIEKRDFIKNVFWGIDSTVLKEMSSVFFFRITSIIISILTGFLLARVLGPFKYGIYSYCINWIAIFVTVVLSGYPNFILREVSSTIERKKFQETKGILIWCYLWVFSFSVVVFFIMYHLLRIIPGVNEIRYSTILILFPSVLLQGWFSITSYALKGLKKIVLSSFPLQSFLFLLMITLKWFHHSTAGLEDIVMFLIISQLISLFFFVYIEKKALPQEVLRASAAFHITQWVLSALQLFIVDAMFMVNSRLDILMLGALGSSEEVGFYRLASQLSAFVAFPLTVVNFSIAPRIVPFHERREYKSLAIFIRKLIRLAFIGAVFLLAIYVFYGQHILAIPGQAYKEAYPSLLILSLGQLVNVGAGSVGWVLVITRHEKDLVVGVGLSVLVNGVLNFLLTPRYGHVGTAVATAMAMMVWNLALTIFVWKRLKIRVSAI